MGAAEKMIELMGASGGVIAGAFRRMEIAEEEIAAAKLSAPRAARKLHGAFKALCPTEFTRGSDELYRRHCREILGRVKRAEDLGPGTDAEVAYMLSQATLAHPPGADLALAYATVFIRVFPEHADIAKSLDREYLPGRHLEIIAEARRKIGQTVKRGTT